MLSCQNLQVVAVEQPSEMRNRGNRRGSHSLHMIIAQIEARRGVTELWRMKDGWSARAASFP